MEKETTKPAQFIFQRREYKLFFIGLAVIVLGFLLMSGGASEDPNVFNEEIYNFRRIRLAPGLVLAGFGIMIYTFVSIPKRN